MTTKQKSALGRGMGALLANNVTVADNSLNAKQEHKDGVNLIPIQKIITNKNQPRKIFKDKELYELSLSIKENGVIQPISVTQTEDGKFEIVAGERRYRASKLAGLDSVPAIIKKASKKDLLAISIIENIQRSDLNCVEEALAYYQLMNEFNLTQEEVAKKLGKERSSVANLLRILKLPREVIQFLQREELSLGHAKVLASVKEEDKCKRYADIAATDNLSVRELEKLIKKSPVTKASNTNKFFDEKVDALKKKLETKTGFHFNLKTKQNGSGSIEIKFSDEVEFNTIYEYLSKR